MEDSREKYLQSVMKRSLKDDNIKKIKREGQSYLALKQTPETYNPTMYDTQYEKMHKTAQDPKTSEIEKLRIMQDPFYKMKYAPLLQRRNKQIEEKHGMEAIQLLNDLDTAPINEETVKLRKRLNAIIESKFPSPRT